MPMPMLERLYVSKMWGGRDPGMEAQLNLRGCPSLRSLATVQPFHSVVFEEAHSVGLQHLDINLGRSLLFPVFQRFSCLRSLKVLMDWIRDIQVEMPSVSIVLPNLHDLHITANQLLEPTLAWVRTPALTNFSIHISGTGIVADYWPGLKAFLGQASQSLRELELYLRVNIPEEELVDVFASLQHLKKLTYIWRPRPLKHQFWRALQREDPDKATAVLLPSLEHLAVDYRDGSRDIRQTILSRFASSPSSKMPPLAATNSAEPEPKTLRQLVLHNPIFDWRIILQDRKVEDFATENLETSTCRMTVSSIVIHTFTVNFPSFFTCGAELRHIHRSRSNNRFDNLLEMGNASHTR